MVRSRSGEEPPEPTRAEGPPRARAQSERSRSVSTSRPRDPRAGGGASAKPAKSRAHSGGGAALLADDDESLNLVEESGATSSQSRSEPLPESERAFGRYTLLRRLAYGGMGEIFLARQGGVGSLAPVAKLVVIKRILSHMKRDEKHRKMFLDEARLQALLTNPHIVQIHDMGEEGGHVYLAMEHVHGPSWRGLIDRCRREREHIPLAHVAEMVAQAARGLSYAHNLVDVTGNALRIVHRDINPHNVLVNYDGEVKIIDFGIAKSELADGQTETGTIKGKFSYMSPEQSAAQQLDHRSDVFALGICLYELLTLDNPFRKANVVLSLESIQRDAPPPLERRRRDAGAFQTVVDKCLAKDRDDRFNDCADIARVLDSLVAHGVVPHADKPLSTWLREMFADEIAAHVQILEQTGSSASLAVHSRSDSSSRRVRAATRPNALDVAGGADTVVQDDAVVDVDVASEREITGVTSAELRSFDGDVAPLVRAQVPERETAATPSPARIRADDAAEPTESAGKDAGRSSSRPRPQLEGVAAPSEAPGRARWPFVAAGAGLLSVAGALALVQVGAVDRMLAGRMPFDFLEPSPAAPLVADAPRDVVVPPKDPTTPPPERREPDPVPPPEQEPDPTPAPEKEPDETPPEREPPPDPAPAKEPGDTPPPMGDPPPRPEGKRKTTSTKQREARAAEEAPKRALAGTLLVTSEGYQVKGGRKLELGGATTLVVDDDVAPYAVKLRVRADDSGAVTFDVESEPWAIVRVDGVGKGKSPQRGLALPKGRRAEIELTNPKTGAMKLTLMLGGK